MVQSTHSGPSFRMLWYTEKFNHYYFCAIKQIKCCVLYKNGNIKARHRHRQTLDTVQWNILTFSVLCWYGWMDGRLHSVMLCLHVILCFNIKYSSVQVIFYMDCSDGTLWPWQADYMLGWMNLCLLSFLVKSHADFYCEMLFEQVYRKQKTLYDPLCQTSHLWCSYYHSRSSPFFLI